MNIFGRRANFCCYAADKGGGGRCGPYYQGNLGRMDRETLGKSYACADRYCKTACGDGPIINNQPRSAEHHAAKSYSITPHIGHVLLFPFVLLFLDRGTKNVAERGAGIA